MEKMPFQPKRGVEVLSTVSTATAVTDATDWRTGLPVLTGSLITLREMRVSDAASLFEALTTEEVSRFISPPPSTVEGFEKFIAWSHRQREAGQYACFAVVPRGSDRAVGLFQIRSLEPGFATGEWGFAIASEYWGTGVFLDGANMMIEFAIRSIGVRRIEARAAVRNGRGNGALRKIGAVQEAVLRRSILRRGEYLDQALWTILADDWSETPMISGPSVIH